MIDPGKRLELSEALTSLIEGRMTNDQFSDACAEHWAESTDRAVAMIGSFGDSLYTDAMTYRLEGDRAVDDETRSVADRCVLFLGAGLEYEWPDPPSTALQGIVGGFTMFLLLPFGVVMLIGAALLWTADFLMVGLSVLALCWFLWKWSRNDDTPEWREYWSRGDREAWPFLHLADYERAMKRARD